MNITLPEFVDTKTLAILFDSEQKRVREMVEFLRTNGYGIEIIRWGTNGRRVKYNYPQFKRALLEYSANLAKLKAI